MTQVRELLVRGRKSDALQVCAGALGSYPDNTDLLGLYGDLLLQLSRPAEAEACFHRLLAASPANAAVMNRLAAVLFSQGKQGEAERICRQAVSLAPGNAEIHANLGNILAAQRNVDAAERSFRRALEITPGFQGAWLNLGNLYKAQQKYTAAEECYLKVLQVNPGFIAIYIGLAECCLGLGEPARALEYYDRALSANPAFIQAHLNKAAACALLGRNEEALACLDRVLQLEPRHADALYSRGLIHKQLGDFARASADYRKALSIRPDNDDARMSLALLELLYGHYAQGWRLYTARRSMRQKTAAHPDILPADLTGRRILVLKDQGLGDEIFFLRFAPELHKRGAWVAYQADPKIRSIVSRLSCLDSILVDGEQVGDVDTTVSVGDLPFVLGYDDRKRIPPPARLTVQQERLATIREMLRAAGPGPWIGITWWAGTRNPEMMPSDRFAYREIPLDLLAGAIRSICGTAVVLQRGGEGRDIERLSTSLDCPVLDAGHLNDDLEGMLCMLDLLDDYAGVDNTNMHLSAGIGKPCRILVPHPPEWRIQIGVEQTPWFPGFRLYRQDAGGDWGSALARLRSDLLQAHAKVRKS